MIDIDEKLGAECQKFCKTIVDDKNYEDFKHAVLMASPSGEGQSEHSAFIAHGRLLAIRDMFDLFHRLARPATPPPKKRGGSGSGVDPDLDSD